MSETQLTRLDRLMMQRRKLFAFCFAMVVTAALGFVSQVSGDNIEAIFIALIWAFVAGNSAEHLSKNLPRRTE